ncbi:carboxylesterase/lipase family protein, partial [Nonomuraea sp. NPDC001684]
DSVPVKPVVDGDLIPAVPLDALRAGAGGRLPLLVGCTSQEADVFVRGMAAGLDEAAARAALDHLGVQVDEPGLTPAERVGRAVTRHLFTRETCWIREARPAYGYEFRWESPVESPAGGGRVGAVHNLDLPFVFDVLDAPGVARTAGPGAPQALADAMHAAWVRFARTGDPGWPLGHTMIFDDPAPPA